MRNLPPALGIETVTFACDGSGSVRRERLVAVEVPVNVVYGTVPYAVMMASPGDLDDFAVGFSLTEGVIRCIDDVRGVRVVAGCEGVRVDVDLVPARLHAVLARRRSMRGRTGCGVCGIEELDALPRAPGPVDARPVRLRAVRRALGELEGWQALNDATRAVHAAAWAGADGRIVAVREDVGRHNALDKLIGALLARGVDASAGFVVVTSRCSYEMVEKVAAFGAGTLVAISAPTSLGVERAVAHGMTLIGVARGDSVTAYAGAERVVMEAAAFA